MPITSLRATSKQFPSSVSVIFIFGIIFDVKFYGNETQLNFWKCQIEWKITIC